MDKATELKQWIEIADKDFAFAEYSDLEELEKLCEKIKPEFSGILEKCSYLTGYSVASRYPSEMKVEKTDMDRALEYTRSIREFFNTRFPDQFKNRYEIVPGVKV